MIAAADPRVLVAAGQSRDADGTLTVGGIRTDELARSYGTPLVIYDIGTFERNFRAFTDAARPHGISVAYAAKAFLASGFAKRLANYAELELDVCSLGEIVTAERGEFPASRMYLHGCGKRDVEIDAAIDGRVAFIVADAIAELRAIAQRASGRPVKVGLRINTGIDAHTHEFIRTGGENTKFGILPRDFPAALDVLDDHKNLTLAGVHAHIGSQIFDEAPFGANVDALIELTAVAHERRHRLQFMLLGGGFGVSEDITQQGSVDLHRLLSDLARRAAMNAQRAGVPLPRLGIEPGRALIATAGTTLYRVASIKDSGTRRFVVIDGGMADNPRPAIYGAFHQPLVAHSAAGGPLRPVTLAGRSCENDVLLDTELPDDVRTGDLLVLCTTGAYTYAMASNYNRFGRPAVVLTDNGRHQLLVRRENTDDVVRNDVL